MMKSPKFLFLILPLFILAGCSLADRSESESARSGTSSSQTKAENDQTASAREQNPTLQEVSLKQADQSHSMAEAMDRKIIRDADLTLEVGSPAEAQRKIELVVFPRIGKLRRYAAAGVSIIKNFVLMLE